MSHARISQALNALVFEPEPDADLHEVLDRFYAPDYTHRSDGHTLDRAQFADMVARIRTQVAGGSVTVVDELRDGSAYAERHRFHLVLADGSTQDREVTVFATLADDGRFHHLSETGFDLTEQPTEQPTGHLTERPQEKTA